MNKGRCEEIDSRNASETGYSHCLLHMAQWTAFVTLDERLSERRDGRPLPTGLGDTDDSLPTIDRYAPRALATSSKPQMVLCMPNAEVRAMMRLLSRSG